MAKWVDKPTLPMDTPWHVVVADLVDSAIRSRRNCTFDKAIRIVNKYFDAYRSTAK